MAYLAHTAHWQFFGLVLAVVGVILATATCGVDDWRVWYVDDVSVISGGWAWVGIWRACFYSHALERAKFCSSMWITDPFLPLEVMVAQVLCTLAVPVGIGANLVGGYAVRRAYFNVGAGRVRAFFLAAALLYFLTASCMLVPLIWNVDSVLQNRTIDFPPEFFMPPAPYRQEVGLGVAMGGGSSAMILVSALLFLLYRQPRGEGLKKTEAELRNPSAQRIGGKENLGYAQEEL